MKPSWESCWAAGKGLLALTIIGFIGRQLYADLSSESALELWRRCTNPGLLATAGALYLAGLTFCFILWFCLLRRLGQMPALLPAIRAYFIGLMGKYVPGKAWALLLRGAMIRSRRVDGRIAIATAVYEVLTTMTGGALLAGLVFLCLRSGGVGSVDSATLWRLLRLQESEPTAAQMALVLISFGLALAVGIPLVPAVFDWVIRRLITADHPPSLGWRNLALGLVLSIGCWSCFGLSLWLVLGVVNGRLPGLTLRSLLLDSGGIALAYVAGFVILLTPSGLGVREFFLRFYLLQEIGLRMPADEARTTAALTVLLLRLVWTAAEILMVAVVYWLPGPELHTIEGTAEPWNAGST